MDKKHITFISGEKCDLAVCEDNYIDFIVRLRNHPDVRYFMSNRFPINSTQIKEYIKRKYDNNEIILIIIDKVSGNPAGLIHLGDYNWPNGRAMLSIAILPEYHGAGLGSESTELIVDHAFNTLGLRKICLEVYEFNEKAIKLYTKLNFITEGEYKKHSLKNGKYYTLYFMTLLRENYKRRK